MPQPATTPDRRRLQGRVVRVLAAGQVLGGLGTGAALGLGALLVAEVAGSPAWSGMSATMGTLGAALLSVPLATLALRRGRRVSLTTGAVVAVLGSLVVVVAAVAGALLPLLLGVLLVGAATSLNLQARFAATDLAAPDARARDLSLVVWATTVGAVVGPNLYEPGEDLGRALGVPPLAGGFVIAAVAQAVGALVYLVGLRPDPLLTAAADDAARTPADTSPAPRAGGLRVLRESPPARRAVLTVALSHAVMVALMSMTPVHLTGHGATMTAVGLTISLHVAGMFALSPVFGYLADRWGRRQVVLVGQALLLASLLLVLVGAESHIAVVVALVLLGLGWSASTVAGSALVVTAVEPARRPALQGVSDALMSLAGAVGGALAGPVLTLLGFGGLAGVLVVLVAVTTAVQLRPPVVTSQVTDPVT
ncbi:MFS transporter [Cellulomonas shaoxiangyii]|uniref:MFS transporter n=1 Tax=Cellulomonas shaoxiangyii TaxID=2566013 RepID=A0A4V1CN25_9CELL|nr:MFS transporter [Cellulomonas shaoxiangyii]QCB94965.1 MFS transporter [Cellulomonas shaoxiangyii]TGY82049.1 MFS transporter [Cellulomonas shaoxiangyii]